MQTLRHRQILAKARETERVTVDGLAEHFGVTLQTIRRDLTELAEAGFLERVHGGAVLPSGLVNIRYEARRALNEAAKRAIGQTAARRVPNGSSLFLNIGTTTEAVARALVHHQGLLVVTNNMNVARILSANPDCELVLSGGRMRSEDEGLVGAAAAGMVSRYRFDMAIIGCSGLDPGGDVLDFDMDEAEVTRTALSHTRDSLLVCDHSKLARRAPVRVTTVQSLGAVVTDVPLPPALSKVCSDEDVEILVASRL